MINCFLKIIPVFVTIVIFAGCASQPPNLRYYQSHEKEPFLIESANKFKSYQNDVPAISKRNFVFRVYKDTEPNAFVQHDFKRIYIYIADSLLSKLNGNDIYCVIAHECAHVEYNHSVKQFILANTLSMGFAIANAALPNYGIGYIGNITNPLLVTAYSRSDEIASDNKALEYLIKMNIPYTDYIKMLEMVRVISVPQYESKRKSSGGGLLDTHPNFEQRIQNAERKGKSIQQKAIKPI